MNYLNGVGSAPFDGVQNGIAPANAGRVSRNVAEQSIPAQDDGNTSLSASGGMLAGALSGSDVRMDRVASLKASIDAGAYHISAAAVANKMLSALLT